MKELRNLQREVEAQKRLLERVVRAGTVAAADPGRYMVRVQFPGEGGLVSDWLPVLTPRAEGDSQQDLPRDGESVLCLFLPVGGAEVGWVLGAMFSTGAPPPSAEPHERVRVTEDGARFTYDRQTGAHSATYPDGTTINYDRAAQKLTADVKGAVDVIATLPILVRSMVSITAQAPSINVLGNSPTACAFEGDIALEGSLSVDGMLLVTGNLGVGGDLGVAGTVGIGGDLTVAGKIEGSEVHDSIGNVRLHTH